MRGLRAGSTAAVLACVLVVGCSGGADPAPEDPATSATASSATPVTSEEASPAPSAADTEDTAETAETGSEESEVGSPAASASPVTGPAATQTLAIEQRHPNGSVLRVTSLEIEPNAITVGIEVVNGATRDFGLATGGAVVRLTDDLGGVYEFLRPQDNPELLIEQRGTLTGELVYFGVLNPEATALRLQTNTSTGGTAATEVYDPATETVNEPFPHFSVEIPLAP